MSDQEAAWMRTQKKTFFGWCNVHLKKKGQRIENLITDFQDGLKLAVLLEILAPETADFRKMSKSPKFKIHKIQNLNYCLDFIKESGVKLIGISAEEIHDGNEKMILGMIWTIIRQFQIQGISIEEKSAKEGLLRWVQRCTENYPGLGDNVRNFHIDFANGMVFNALIHKHRPDLIDYDSLKPTNRASNLQNAFDVAERSLDIEPILDVESMIDTPKPDEKSVMTYIIFYFQAFSAGKQVETAGKRVAKLVEFTLANDKIKNDYVSRATALLSYINEKITFFQAPQFPDSLDGMIESFNAFKAYTKSERPPKGEELLELEGLFNSLQTKLRLNLRAPFEPAPELIPPALWTQWNALSREEKTYSNMIREELRRQKDIAHILARFDAKNAKVAAWVKEKEIMIAEASIGSNLSEVQAMIRNHEAFVEEFKTVKASFSEQASAFLSNLGELRYSQLAGLQEKYDALLSGPLAALEQSSDSRHSALTAELQKLQEVDDMLVAFASQCASIALWTENIDENMTQPITAETLEAINTLKSNFDALNAELQTKKDELATLSELATKLREQGVAEDRYSAYTLDAINQKWSDVLEVAEKRRSLLEQELQAQASNEDLCKLFAEKAAHFVAWAEEKNEVVNVTLEGTLEEQHKLLQGKLKEILMDKIFLEELVDLSHQIEERGIFSNVHTDEDIESLKLKYEKLTGLIKKNQQVLQNQMHAESDRGVSAEQMAEYRECFDFFDTNNNGHLEPLEFMSCMKSLGEDVSEDNLKEKFAEIDVKSIGYCEFDDFVQYMDKKNRDTDSPEQIKEAFKVIAGEKDFITVDQMRTVINDEEVLTYIIENMEPYPDVEGAYDYSKFTDFVYSC